jgi:tRNA nucleotidyltransferase (CCA-adding enzyme)
MIGFAVASQQDLWRHSLHCVDACPPRPLLRLAALLHDAGKPLCDRERQPQEDPFEGHEQHGAELCELLLERLRFSNRDRQLVTALVRHHRIGYGTDWDAAAVRRWIFRVSPDLVEDLLALARADLLSKTPKDGRRAAQLDSLAERARTALREGVVLSLRDLAVNGNDLTLELGREPGAWLGRLLQQLLEEVVADPSLNCRDTLLARARTITAR